MTDYTPFRQQIVDTCHDLVHKGYLSGTGGNVSLRVDGEEALAITPSGLPYLSMTAEDVCVVSFDGERLAGALKPSIEIGMHTAVLRHRPDVNAVVHTHQPYASIFALLNRPIPALFDEQVMQLGREVIVVPYGRSGTEDLAGNLAACLENHANAYILQNHGAICTGITMEQTVINAQVLEKCARVYHYALSSGQPITRLPQASADAFFQMLREEQEAEAARKAAS